MNSCKKTTDRLSRLVLLSFMLLAGTGQSFAAGPRVPSEMENPLAIILVLIAIALLVVIGLLAFIVIGAAKYYAEKLKEQREKESTGIAVKATALLLLCIASTRAIAADEITPKTSKLIGGLSTTSFYTLGGVIALEVLVILMLILFLKTFIAKEKAPQEASVAIPKDALWKIWWTKINKLRPIKEESEIMLDHNYDGIRELDNKLPPWWLYGFYATIIFSFIYLYRHHVAHSAPSSIQEYEAAVAKANIEKEAYLKNAASKVDETSVVLLTNDGALAEGKKLFTGTCVACHGNEGQGGVGPNLTDDYWLHGGDIKDIFKTIKYGVPEKGMKSWKDDFSPVQIAEMASYIKTLHGTNPASAKEPQGELYVEQKLTADSANATQPVK